MATAGYSGTPLIKKLGIKPEMKLLLINQPPDYFELWGGPKRAACKKRRSGPGAYIRHQP
jgi:hypothetical protein